jgi:streptogramin lyase
MTKARGTAYSRALLVFFALTACRDVEDAPRPNGPPLAAAPRSRIYTFDADFDTGNLYNVNHEAPKNHQLQLDTKIRIAPYLWVANWVVGTVTKIDTRTGQQVAKYDSVLQRNWDGSIPDVRPPREEGSMGSTAPCGNTPSRTSVDAYGDAYIANRTFCGQPSATKYAGEPTRCVDRNGNGLIDTSRDANADGIINIKDPAEFKGQADECILWTKNYGASGSHGRSLAVDADQNVWVGTYMDSMLYKLDGETGAVLQTINPNAERGTTGHLYGIAIGPGGFIYTSNPGNNLLRKIDPNPAARKHVVEEMPSPVPTYGIAVDSNGVVWLGRWTSPAGGGVVRADFAAKTARVVGNITSACSQGNTRGVAVDAQNNIWAACWSEGLLLQFNNNGTLIKSWPVDAGPIGVAIDAAGKVWTVNQSGDSATRVDPETDATNTFHTSGEPYSYSDMTGFQQRHMGVRQGYWTAVHDSVTSNTQWGTVTWNAEAQGSTPPGTAIIVEVRAANDPSQLAARPFVAVSNGVVFNGVVGRYVEVRATLKSQDGETSPVLSDLRIDPINTPPVAICKAINVCAEPGVCFANANIDNGSFDPDGDPITLTQVPPGPYSIGSRDVMLEVSDGELSDTCTAPVTVRDCEPPVITSSQVELWPPNHKLQSFTLSSCATAVDTCQGPIDIDAAGTITAIYSDEPEDAKGSGDGNTSGDIVITGSSSFKLRSERQGAGNGRVYNVSFGVSDAAGNVAIGNCRFVVPHDQSGQPAADDGPGAGYVVIAR